jgi:signal transduction histidine kinase
MNWFNSIRGRLALVSALVIALVLTIAGVALVVLFKTYIEKRVAEELRGRVLDVAGAFSLDPSGQPALMRTPSDPRYKVPYGGAYWYVREGDTVVLRSRSLWDADVERQRTSMAQSGDVVDATGPDSNAVYLLEKNVSLGEGQAQRNYVLGVALDQSDVRALSSSFGSETAAALSLIGLVLFAGAWLQASYGLRPLVKIKQQLALLHEGERGQLDGPFPVEVEALTHDLNALFFQQREMIARARERAGALAHGLKTPMTVLYGEARKLELANQTQSAHFIRAQLDQIRHQVDRELTRARVHGASVGIGLHADVSATTTRLVELMKRMPQGSDIDWNVPEPGVHVAMDADDLGEVLGNLLDNARKWAKSTVRIDAAVLDSGHVRISVCDDGPGIPADLRDKAMERGETIAGLGGGHAADGSGLGLAIVSDLLASYASSVNLHASELGGSHVSFDIAGSQSPRNPA